MRNSLLGILKAFCAFAALMGALLVGWMSFEVYYLVTGRTQPDIEQPPLGAVIPLLLLGVILLVGGWGLQKWLSKYLPS